MLISTKALLDQESGIVGESCTDSNVPDGYDPRCWTMSGSSESVSIQSGLKRRRSQTAADLLTTTSRFNGNQASRQFQGIF